MNSPAFLAPPTERAVPLSQALLVDRLGIWASALCVVHCALTPLLLSFSAVVARLLPSEESTHRSLSMVVALLGTVALVRGFDRHRRMSVLVCMLAGMGCIMAAAWWGGWLPSAKYEIGVTMLGSSFMIAAHRLNHRFGRDCGCSTCAQEG